MNIRVLVVDDPVVLRRLVAGGSVAGSRSAIREQLIPKLKALVATDTGGAA